MTEDLRKQINELNSVHTGLTQIVEHDEQTLVSGTLCFEASPDGMETIGDSFDVELTVPNVFPDRLPRAKEIGGRIGPDYEHLNPDGTLCVAVPIEQRRVFFEQPSLLGFVNRLLVPYLYGFCFWRKHGHHPFDAAAHGSEGILDHYVDTLGLEDPLAALAVVCFLLEHGYRGHHSCPCGSGRRVRACHGSALRALHNHHTLETLLDDFRAICDICLAKHEEGQLAFPRLLLNQVVRLIEKTHGLTQGPSERRRRPNARRSTAQARRTHKSRS